MNNNRPPAGAISYPARRGSGPARSTADGERLDGEATGSRIGAVILAAGSSSRFRASGGLEATKLVADLGGQPIVRRVAEAALASRARPVVAVVGHARGSVEAVFAGLGLELAFNPDFMSGLASSLRVGLAAMPPGVRAALVLLGDMPEVGATLIDTLIEAYLGGQALAAVPMREGRRGNPVLLGRGLFEAAMRLEGDEGARRLVAALAPRECVEVAAPDLGAILDIDTPADLAAARRSRGRAR